MAIPAGMVIWLMANINVDGMFAQALRRFFAAFRVLAGNGRIYTMAFVLGFPANEIVIPIIIMSYLSAGTLTEAAA